MASPAAIAGAGGVPYRLVDSWYTTAARWATESVTAVRLRGVGCFVLSSRTGVGGWFGPMESVAWSTLQPDSELARFRLEPDEPGEISDPTFHFAIRVREVVLPPIWKYRDAHEYVTEIRNHIKWTVLPTIRALGS